MKTIENTAATKGVVTEFYTGLASRDLDTVALKFAETIDWYIPGEQLLAPWLGQRTKRTEVKEFFELLLNNIESVSFELEHILAENDFAVATGKFVSKMLKTGINYSSPFSAHFTVKDNQIIAYRFLEDSNALVKALTTNNTIV